MKLAYSTNAYTKHSLSDAIRSIAKLGYDGIEILCDKPHWFVPEVGAASVEHTVQLLDQCGLKVSNLNANTSDGFFPARTDDTAFEPALSNLNRAERDRRIAYTKGAIDFASIVDARAVSVTSGLPKGSNQQAFRFFVDSLKEICDYADQQQVRVGIEYEPGLLVEYAEQVMDAIEQVGSPLLGVNFDIGHSFLNHEAPADTVALLGDRIWNIHIEDIANNTHFHMIPGTGSIPFDEYFSALRKIEYNGYITVELYTFADAPEDAGRQSLEYLRAKLES